MHRDGHLGAALLAYAPVGLVMMAASAPVLAILGAATSVALSMVPDWDMRVPGLNHRGVTHTLGFALLVGVVVGTAASAVGGAAGLAVDESLSVLGFRVAALHTAGFLVGTLAVLSHLGADALTPMGVPLLWPVSDHRFSLGVATADSTLANYGLLLAGAAATVGWALPMGGG